MLLRTITLAGGLAGAAGLSQFPEFSQQYVQRLGGAVDELSRFVSEFDADAASLGLGREAALAQLAQGGAMGEKRAETMARTITRHDRLADDLAALQAAGPFSRAYAAGRLTDAEIAAKAWENFRPALPLTFEGAVFGGAGMIAGMAVVGALLALLRRLVARRGRVGAAPSA
jgi:hypothetical protein